MAPAWTARRLGPRPTGRPVACQECYRAIFCRLGRSISPFQCRTVILAGLSAVAAFAARRPAQQATKPSKWRLEELSSEAPFRPFYHCARSLANGLASTAPPAILSQTAAPIAAAESRTGSPQHRAEAKQLSSKESLRPTRYHSIPYVTGRLSDCLEHTS